MSQLTVGQLTALKAAIAADPALNAQPGDSNGVEFIKQALNQLANPAVAGWRTDVPVSEIVNSISWDKFTPTDLPPSIPESPATADICSQLLYLNRLMLIQTKQINLNTVVASAAGAGALDFSKPSVRGAIRDAVIQLPAGGGGANVNAAGAGGVDALTAGTRSMTRAEVVLKVGQANTGAVTAQLFGFQGSLTLDDVRDARAL